MRHGEAGHLPVLLQPAGGEARQFPDMNVEPSTEATRLHCHHPGLCPCLGTPGGFVLWGHIGKMCAATNHLENLYCSWEGQI